MNNNMFDDDDAERLASFENAIPDGIIDGRQYANIVSNILEHLSDLKADNYVSGITFVMRSVNECYDYDEEQNKNILAPTKAVDAVTALSYFILTLRDMIDDDDFELYINNQRDEMMPELMSGAETIPYYDIEKHKEKIEELMNMLDEMDEDE